MLQAAESYKCNEKSEMLKQLQAITQSSTHKVTVSHATNDDNGLAIII